MAMTAAQLAEQIGAQLVGCGDGDRYGIGEGSDPDKKRIGELNASNAGAVIIGSSIESIAKPQLVVENVDGALIEVLKIFAPKLTAPKPGIDPDASVGDNVQIAASASIGAHVAIANGVRIGANTVIASGCCIGENTTIGENCRLDNNVVIYHNCSIGNGVIILANSTIGSTGFGYSFIDGEYRLVPHNGGVIIEDFVEVGANTCIDRAKFDNTVIGAGTKIDNLVQIAHNVVIGKCCIIAGLVGISGSCTLGDEVIMSGGSGMKDNITIGDGVIIGAVSTVFHSVGAGEKVLGTPAVEYGQSLRITAATKHLPKMVEQLRKLKKKVKALEASKNDKD
jgi:UDP-3-O-[3-hydroxymyristoyl] glucosamine N-acyltransferase